jgi:DNA-binding transcriptional regulator YhcF (GntR family)
MIQLPAVIRIDLDSARPLEEQITLGIRQALAEGILGAGAELPSVRQLAGDLGVHWNTVARAYRRLADEGVLVVRRGRGAVVGGERRTTRRTAKASLRARLTEAIAAGLVCGLSPDDVAVIFSEALAGFGGRK